jgi:hypothetical protein
VAVTNIDQDGTAATTGNSDTISNLDSTGGNYVIGSANARDDTVDSATYNGNSMARIGTAQSQGNVNSSTFGKVEASPGDYAMVFNYSSSTDSACFGATYSGVDESDAEDGLNSAAGTNDATPESDLTIATTTGDMIFTTFAHEDTLSNTVTPNSGEQTEFANSPQVAAAGNRNHGMSAGYRTGNGSLGVGWDQQEASADWVHLAVNINQEAAGGQTVNKTPQDTFTYSDSSLRDGIFVR